MNPSSKIWPLLVASLLLLPLCAPGQDSLRVVILSPKLGPVITPAHREQYRVFQQVEGFQRAVICRSDNGAFYARIEILSPSGTVRSELRPYSYALLCSMAEKVEHFDEIVAGWYKMGSRPADLTYADGSSVEGVLASNPTSLLAARNSLPFVGLMEESPFEPYPLLRAGVGVSPFRLEGLPFQEMLNRLRDLFAARGYPVSVGTYTANREPLVLLSLNLMLSSSWGATLEAATAQGDDVGAEFYSVSLSLVYRPSIGIPFLRPYASLGAAHYRLKLARTLGSRTRVSAIDKNGAYSVLENIDFSGEANTTGGVGELGFELLLPVDIDVFARCMSGPRFHIDSSWGESRELFPERVAFGIRAMICF